MREYVPLIYVDDKFTSVLHVAEEFVEKFFPLGILVDFVQLKQKESKDESVTDARATRTTRKKRVRDAITALRARR